MNVAQHKLLDDMVSRLKPKQFVLGAFLIGSFAKGSSDNLSDIDICFVVRREYWDKANEQLKFLGEREDLIYSDHSLHGSEGSFARFIFSNFTSTEVHFIAEESSFKLYDPYKILFDKCNSIIGFKSKDLAKSTSAKPAFSISEQEAAWDIFNLFKKAVRGDVDAVLDWAEILVGENRAGITGGNIP